jgi:hypothetical protein
MITRQYEQLENGPMDEIDAAVWSGDMFHNRANVAAFREMMARWEQGLREVEDILTVIGVGE